MQRTIMIVDDESIIRQSFVDWFEDREWITIEAESGEQALEILKTETIDCAIVDIRMGGINGEAFIREAGKNRNGVVFVICTGSPEYSIPPDLLKLSFVFKDVFRKPVVEFAELEQALLWLIEQNKARVI